MPTRPDHWTTENAAQFQHPSVVERYPLRAPYPAELFDLLIGLVHGTPRAVLDVGTGTGDLARPLAARTTLARVDAVDPSAAMLELARRQPGGDSPRLRWIAGTAEDAPLNPPYALVTAGESLHWMDWERVLPRFRAASTPNSLLAICHRLDQREPWHDELLPIIQRYSTMRKWVDFDLIGELEARGLFARLGEHETSPQLFTQPLDDYIAGFHSRSSLSLAALSPEDATAFYAAVRALVAPRFPDGVVRFEVAAGVTWGRAL